MAPPPRGLIVSLLGTSLLLSALASSASAEGAGGVSAQPGQRRREHPAAGRRCRIRQPAAAPPRPAARPRPAAWRTRACTSVRAPACSIDVRRRAARTRARAASRVDPPRRPRPHGSACAAYAPATSRACGCRACAPAATGSASRCSPATASVRSRRARCASPCAASRAASHRRVPRPDAGAAAGPADRAAPVASGGVFPVQGSYSFGGEDSGFGAGRTGHLHEGHDIRAAAGVPVVAPLAGQILFNDYQASGAGRYIVLHADNGWDMFFAHLLAGSATLEPGARVSAGQQIGLVGSTGGSTGPHLHFELWPDGWRQIKGTRPIDPLPQLRAWAGV